MPICTMCRVQFPIAVRGSTICRFCAARRQTNSTPSPPPPWAPQPLDPPVPEEPEAEEELEMPKGEVPQGLRQFFSMVAAPRKAPSRRITWTVYDKTDFFGEYAPEPIVPGTAKVRDHGKVLSGTVPEPVKRKTTRYDLMETDWLDDDQ